MLCKKIVNFFSLLTHTQEAGARKMAITQELLSLVTGLAHYLKILIRIALSASLKLERDHADKAAIGQFLARLDRLARDPNASRPTAAAVSSTTSHAPATSTVLGAGANGVPPPATQTPRTYGYRSLTRAVGTLVGQGEATTDLCEACHCTVEEECARVGTSLRWHIACLRCNSCGRPATKGDPDIAPPQPREGPPLPPAVPIADFRFDRRDDVAGTRANSRVFCSSCASRTARDHFASVTRLEQYAFLLCVALNKLYALLKQRGVVPQSPGAFPEYIVDSTLVD